MFLDIIAFGVPAVRRQAAAAAAVLIALPHMLPAAGLLLVAAFWCLAAALAFLPKIRALPLPQCLHVHACIENHYDRIELARRWLSLANSHLHITAGLAVSWFLLGQSPSSSVPANILAMLFPSLATFAVMAASINALVTVVAVSLEADHPWATRRFF